MKKIVEEVSGEGLEKLLGERVTLFCLKFTTSDGCWQWHAGKSAAGYGMFNDGNGMKYAHRLMWVAAHGAIPSNLVIDHLCRNRGCVNPSHMELVTRGENVLRGVGASALHARKTNCPQGHPYSEENTYVRKDRKGRMCQQCFRDKYQHSKGLQYEKAY
jgi:hypothetical protein